MAKMKGYSIPKPTHVYIGRSNCGCCTAIVSEIPGFEKDTAQEVGDVIKSGRTVERVPWQKYVNEISAEETFMACPHHGKPNNATVAPRKVQVELLPPGLSK